jgi:hypothetical protein
MSRLSNLKQAAKLRRYTPLQPVKRNVTRCSSTFSMINRFFELNPYSDTRDDVLMAYIPNRQEESRLGAVLDDLKNFESFECFKGAA